MRRMQRGQAACACHSGPPPLTAMLVEGGAAVVGSAAGLLNKCQNRLCISLSALLVWGRNAQGRRHLRLPKEEGRPITGQSPRCRREGGSGAGRGAAAAAAARAGHRLGGAGGKDGTAGGVGRRWCCTLLQHGAAAAGACGSRRRRAPQPKRDVTLRGGTSVVAAVAVGRPDRGGEARAGKQGAEQEAHARAAGYPQVGVSARRRLLSVAARREPNRVGHPAVPLGRRQRTRERHGHHVRALRRQRHLAAYFFPRGVPVRLSPPWPSSWRRRAAGSTPRLCGCWRRWYRGAL